MTRRPTEIASLIELKPQTIGLICCFRTREPPRPRRHEYSRRANSDVANGDVLRARQKVAATTTTTATTRVREHSRIREDQGEEKCLRRACVRARSLTRRVTELRRGKRGENAEPRGIMRRARNYHHEVFSDLK